MSTFGGLVVARGELNAGRVSLAILRARRFVASASRVREFSILLERVGGMLHVPGSSRYHEDPTAGRTW